MRKTRDPIVNLREKLLDSGLADTDDIKVPFQTSPNCRVIFTKGPGTPVTKYTRHVHPSFTFWLLRTKSTRSFRITQPSRMIKQGNN